MKSKICTVTTIKATLEQTLCFVNYHLNIGIDHMYIFFDDPNDLAIKKLQKNKKVTCFRCDDKHWRSRGVDPDTPFQKRLELNASFVFELIKKKDYDWMFAHLDGDELIYTEANLKKFLSKISKKTDVICLLPLDSVPEKDYYKNIFIEVNLFRDLGRISRFYYPNKKLLQKIVPFLKRNEGNISGIYFRGHSAGKSIVRVSSQIKKFQGHRPIAKKDVKLKFEFPKNAKILHFNSCGFDVWKEKFLSIHNRVKKTSLKDLETSKNIIELYKEFIETYEKGNEEELKKLYRKRFFIPKHIRPFLTAIGLLKKIKLDPKLFENKT
jgi:hypothetical protein